MKGLVNQMKRIKAACIRQTLVFSQKEGSGFSREHCLECNREEVGRYKSALAPVGDYFDEREHVVDMFCFSQNTI